LREDHSKFQDKGAQIAVVTQGSPEQSAELCRRHNAEFQCLSDPQRECYRAYGLARGSFAQVMSPRILLKATVSALQGNVGRQVGDVFQMPGTFVIDRGGIIRYCHRNRDAADNPPNQAVLAAL
jgi:peroxiredoxin